MKLTIDYTQPLKVVISACYGGFGLSKEALLWLYEKDPYFLNHSTSESDIHYAKQDWCDMTLTPAGNAVLSFNRDKKELRCHPLLVECVETLGEKASGRYSELKVVEVYPKLPYEIDEYDGYERIE